mmetsp:Transcript_886/g.1050  ORF Transcript_886/g.1050 Transcript_886/m.1050 type:complete len:370 (-) Transcript_886:2-1111(-)
MGTLVDITSVDQLKQICTTSPAVVMHFWAFWAEPCKHMDVVLAQLAKENPHASFVRIEAEAYPDLSEEYEVEAVPFFVIYKDGKVVETVEGADPPGLSSKVALHVSTAATGGSAPGQGAAVSGDAAGEEPLNSRIEKLLKSADILLFMKGSPDEPRCGFSRKTSEALKETGLKFSHFDILKNEEIRQGLKTYSNWPTYPQLYAAGDLIGGCDIIMEMHEDKSLKSTLEEALKAAGPQDSLNTRIKNLLESKDVLLFMKGDPQEPRCGFSRKVVEALNAANINFGHFDILKNEEIRQGLKEYSNWPTYPQLYAKGELVGGCDIILELSQSGDLKSTVDEALGVTSAKPVEESATTQAPVAAAGGGGGGGI